MIKSRFMEKQQPVTVIEKNNKVYIYICLNEQEVHETLSEDEISAGNVFEYDFKEIIEESGVLDIDDIKENPENYLHYGEQKSDQDRISKLEAINTELSITVDSILTEVLPTFIGE